MGGQARLKKHKKSGSFYDESNVFIAKEGNTKNFDLTVGVNNFINSFLVRFNNLN